MLVLARRKGQKILIGDDVVVEVVEVAGRVVRLGITAPKNVPVYRQEVWEGMQHGNEGKGGDGCPK